MTGGESIVSFGSLDTWTRALALVGGAIRRRWVSIAVLTAAFVAVGGAAAALLPRTYSTKASLLIKRNYVMPALANPKRAVPTGSDSPTQSAAESVLSHESLRGIVLRNGLVARWDAERPALLRLKDRVTSLVSGPLPEDEKAEILVEVLAKRIFVNVDNEVMTVRAVWTDRATSRDLVNSAVDAFLDIRRKVDVQAIADTYTILKRTAEMERAQVDSQLAAIAGVQQAAAARPARHVPVAAVAAPRAAKDDGLNDLRGRILDARQALAAIAKSHREKLADLETKLAERRASQTDRHPDVVAMKAALVRLRQQPDELAAARAEEARLVADYAARGGTADHLATADRTSGGADEAGTGSVPVAPEAGQPPARDAEDDAVVYARSLFKGSLDTYQDIVDRLRNVEIELATAEVAFNYRYTITAPARLPKKADSPNVPLILTGATLAGALAGVVRAVFKDLHARSLLSPSALTAHLAAPAPESAAS